MSAVIAELDPDDIPQACQLFGDVFGHSTSPEQWCWKYAQGPRLGAVNVVARAISGELLGHAGASIFPGAVRGESVSMAQVCDVMVRASARGGLSPVEVYPQLMTKLQTTLAARFARPYAYGFPGVRPYKLGARLGFYRQLQQCRTACFVPTGSLFQSLHPLRVRAIDWDIAWLDKIWQRLAPSLTRPTVARSAAYLVWRYRDHPDNSYQLWLLSRIFSDCGWFITRAMPNGEICIVDVLLAEATDPAPWVAALRSSLSLSHGKPPPICAWFLPLRENQSVEPIIGIEIRVKDWHTHYPSPIFQPGDTDVY